MKSLNGTWNLLSIQTGEVKEENPYDSERGVLLTFEDGESEGKITGKDVCGNRVMGDYKLMDNQKIEVTRFGGTKRGCDGWGAKFWTMIRAARSFEVNEKTLKIYFESKENVLTFVKLTK